MTQPDHHRRHDRRPRLVARAGAALVAVTAMLSGPALTSPATAAAPPGQGFTVTAGDLGFILKQIKIAERHAATATASNPCGTLVGSDARQIASRLSSFGLRTVDGSCNNLFAGRETFGAAHQRFPRMTPARFREAQGAPAGFPSQASSSYAQKKGTVYDADPRLVSNLVVDQTSTNPAAVSAARFPVRTQGNPGAFPCTTDPDPLAPDPVVGVPAGCVPSHQSLPIPNVTTDVGLSPPFNSLFTFFGQFFDHGVDQTVKGGGTVVVPLAADDPLRTLGPDGRASTGDEVPADRAFMVMTRAMNMPGPDGVVGDDPATAADESADDVTDALNTDSPWVDQSQTYTSHPSHQVFLREYRLDAGRPVTTGRLLGGLDAGQTYPGSPDGRTGLATWASTKQQAADVLGLELSDADATDVPLLATDPYGQFVPGPNGLPQYVRRDGSLLEGDLTSPVAPPADVRRFHVPFLTDLAHHADPSPQDTDRNPATPPVAPTPDPDTTPSATGAGQPTGTYDDEMLDAHFVAGDGRVNENIALSAVHQVFHSEHDRLVSDIETILDEPGNTALSAAFHDVSPGATDPLQRTFSYGDRLFQAARFINEMEYQHIVFEDFGRKVQPAIRPFHVYTPDVDPAVVAEFAHAVYRFGHSMLDDDVARTNPDGSDNSLPLLDAFLNPLAYQDGGSAGTVTPEAAAGSIVLGSSDQIGNEIDEFVIETLRNNLLGLPLDLPTLNIARARDAGVPTLNQVRRTLHEQSNDSQLTPYSSWAELGQHLRHPETLVNLVAAYGTHPTIRDATTLTAKRAAAKAIVDPGADPVTDPADVPADAPAFLFGSDGRDLPGCDTADADCRDWSDTGGVPSTGLEGVDLWVGGLAENTNVFGGLLGSTFNHVFQTQMEMLQEGDRFYYLARTPGLNLRAQLEGNSFAELVQRNTTGTTALKSDAFATADCRFQLANLAGTPAGYTASGSTVTDDQTSEDCDESALLLRRPDGTIQYRATNTVDPPGINGQAVYQGTTGVDRVYGGNDNDTMWGDSGDDRIDGGGGDDIALGGDGDDRITDFGGADVPKGGPGDDAIEAGPGDDIVMGGDGNDLLNGGANDNETFAGNGNDLLIAGTGADVAFGDAGNDWIQGGTGQDLLIGDHGAPFFDDPGEPSPGHDVFVGDAGENDYDAEGGDDIMSQNAAVDRNAGAGGFDWATHQYDTIGADDDLAINNQLDGVALPVVVNRDRWQEVEGVSGSALDDTIRGTDDIPREVGGGGFTGCNALDQAGVNRIDGLDPLLPPLTQDLGPVEQTSAAGACPLTGPVWGEGEIILAGAGNDTIEGRGGDDIIDGDRHLRIRLSIRTNPTDPTTEIGTTTRLDATATNGTFGPGTAGETLQKAIMDGDVDPTQVTTVREIRQTTVATDTDTAIYPGPRSQYTVTVTEGGSAVTVTDTGAGVGTGIDTLRGIERLRFSDQDLSIGAPQPPVLGTATPGPERVTVALSGVSPTTTRLTLQALNADGDVLSSVSTGLTATSRTVTGLEGGVPVSFRLIARSAFGTTSASNTVGPVSPLAPLPAAPLVTSVTPGDGRAVLRLAAGPSKPDAAPTTEYRVRVYANGVYTRTAIGYTDVGADVVVGNLVNGTAYTFQAYAVSGLGRSPFSAMTEPVTPVDVTPPTVTTTNPVDGATGVSRGASPSATFSEPVEGVSGASLRLEAPDGSTVPGVVTLSTNRRTVILNPTPTLAPLTRYSLVLAGGADGLRDVAGHPLESRTVSFTTR